MKILLLIGCLLSFGLAHAEPISGVKRTGFSLQQTSGLTSAQYLKVETLSDEVIHFEFSLTPPGVSTDDPITTTPFIQKRDYTGPSSYTESAQGIETARAKISVNNATGCLTVFDKAKGVTLTTVCAAHGASGSQGFTLTPEKMQNVYGLGEQFVKLGEANGDWIGKTRTPGGKYGNALPQFGGGYTENAQFPILYALGPDQTGYALYVDHVYKQTWDFQGSPWNLQTSGDSLRFYVILGDDLPSLRTRYMDLVGHPLVPPKKAFGLWVSEFGYRNWAEMEDKLRTLRLNHFPIDGFVLDAYWYGGFESNSINTEIGRLAWDEKNFPDPAGEVKRLESRNGIGLMTIEQSYLGQGNSTFPMMENPGYLAREGCSTCAPALTDDWWGKGGMIDWTNEPGAAFWHDQKRKPVLSDIGITFHWTDLGEPEMYDETSWYLGGTGISGHSQADVHNLYNFKWHESIYDGYVRNQTEKRHFILSRSGGPGIQRFGTALWSGDIGSNLPSLASHTNAQMHMSLSGIDYFGCDIGGFHREALQGDLNELYTRWFAQSALFDVPVRPHTDNGSKKNNTPPDRIGDMKSNLASIRLRYELAPYYYSLAHRAALYGEPLVPPLVYYYQNDLNVRTLADEKLIGRDLLVATALHFGEASRAVYLPAGDWVDYRSGAWIHSGGESLPDVAEYVNGVFGLPVFARAGAIIPVMEVDDQTMNMLGRRLDGTVAGDLQVKVFASANPSEFTLYEDDGVSVGYRSGKVRQTRISQKLSAMHATVTVSPATGSFDGASAHTQAIVQLITENTVAAAVSLNGAALTQFKTEELFRQARSGWYQPRRGLIEAKSESTRVSDQKVFDFQLAR